MISISKGGWALAAFIAGLLTGALFPVEVNTLRGHTVDLFGTMVTAAGEGSQSLGEAVAE